jgi:hypothetical protein
MSVGFLFHLIQNSASNKILTITNNIEQMPKERVDDDRDREHRLGDAREELLTSGLRGADLFQDKDWSEGIKPLSGSLTEQSRSLQEGDETFYMRECFCPFRGEYKDPVYCPLDVGFCGAYRGSKYDDFPLACFSPNTRSAEFAIIVFMVILVCRVPFETILATIYCWF